MIKEEIFEKRRKLVVETIKKIKRKRPIMNNRLDSFSWWVWVEKSIQDELFNLLEELKYEK